VARNGPSSIEHILLGIHYDSLDLTWQLEEGGRLGSAFVYSPNRPAALSANICPLWIYLRTIATERCLVWFMMLRSLTPARAAAVAIPERSECPA